jgi:hypothetical protein
VRHARYLAWMAAGALGLLVAYAAAVAALARWAPGRLAPPPIVNELSFDQKLRLLRERRDLDPELLAVGSSMTARNLDMAALAEGRLEPRAAFNGAVMNLTLNQTLFLAEFYLERFRNVRLLLLQTAPFDFRDCTNRPDAFFDRAAAARLAFSDSSLVGFYLSHFDPLGVARRTATGATLPMDGFGYYPVPVSERQAQDRGLRYGVEPLDPACFEALRELAELARRRGAMLVVSLNPVNPAFLELPGADAFIEEFRARVARALAGSGAHLIDAGALLPLGVDDFYDAYHLNLPAAAELARRLGAALPEGAG